MNNLPQLSTPDEPPVEFLVDTPDYQGISRAFESLQGLVTRRLNRRETLANQWLSEKAIIDAMESMFDDARELEIVVAGWIDQAVLEIHWRVQGDRSCLSLALEELNEYRPDQHGDICFYLANKRSHRVLATTFSFEDETISAGIFRKR